MNKSIKTKLIVAIGIPVAMVYACFITSETIISRGEELEDMKTSLTGLVRHHANKLNTTLFGVERTTDNAAGLIADHKFDSLESISAVIKNNLDTNPDIFGSAQAFQKKLPAPYFFRDGKDGVKYINLSKNNYNYHIQDWFLIPILLKKSIWTDPYHDTGGGDILMCTYSAPIKRNGEAIGVVTADIGISELRKAVDSAAPKGGACMLISRDGTFIAHPNPDHVMRESLFSLAEWHERPDMAELGRRALAGESGIERLTALDGETPEWFVFTPVKTTGWSLIAVLPESMALAEVRSQLWRNIIETAIGLTLIFLIIFVIASKLAKPFKKLAQVSESIADGDIRLAMGKMDRMDTGDGSDGDETKLLARSIKQMTVNLNNLVSAVKCNTDQINLSSAKITGRTMELETSAVEQAAATTEVGASCKQIAATAKKLVETMNAVKTQVRESAEMAERGNQGISNITSAMQRILLAADSISRQLATINDKTEKINFAVTTIVNVADRTNLLSLNASIEAENAGEHGRGFAVVAAEIKKLADETAAAALKIEAIVSESGQAIAAGVAEVESFADDVRHESDTVSHTGEQLNGIIERVKGMEPGFKTVGDGITDQSESADSIAEAIGELGNSANQSIEAIKNLNAIANALAAGAVKLQDDIARFKVDYNACEMPGIKERTTPE